MIIPGRPDDLTPLTVQMLPQTESGAPAIKSSTHALSSGASEVHMVLPGRPDVLDPLTVQLLPENESGSPEIKASTHALSSSPRGPSNPAASPTTSRRANQSGSAQSGTRNLVCAAVQ